jgi:hypothetical protein
MTDVDAATVAALAARLDELEARTRTLEAENASLRARAATTEAAPPICDSRVGRRRVLTGGLAAAAGAAAGAVLLEGAPVAAADGSTMHVGAVNTANRITVVNATGGDTNQGESAFEVQDNGAFLSGQYAGIGVVARNQRFNTGVHIDTNVMGMSIISSLHGMSIECEGRALDISSSGDGMQAVADETAVNAVTRGTGTALSAHAINGDGGTGVSASGGTTGVAGSAFNQGGIGVEATASNGFGLQATATIGTGLKARGSVFGVIAQSLTKDPTQAALFASAIDGMAIGCNTDTGQVFDGVSTWGGGMRVSAPLFHLRLANVHSRGAPTADKFAHQKGDVVETSGGELWVCTAGGTPGVWRKVAGPTTAGALHVLAPAVRVYDSRPGLAPTTVGPKTPLVANTPRTFDLTANASHVPADATAAMVTLVVTNAATTGGNLTIWANGGTRPAGTTLAWGGKTDRCSTLAVTALDAKARMQVVANAPADLAIDVIGYYR